MAHKSYLPRDDAGVLTLLVALDTNLPGARAAKYDVTTEQLFRLKQGRLAFAWLLEAGPLAQNWSAGVTAARERMFSDPPGEADPLPGLPTLPAVPTIPVSGSSVPAQLEPGFFDFLGRLVQQIKNHDDYDSADGPILGIVGAEIAPPDVQTIPEVKYRIGPSGRPILSVKKTPFQGYSVTVARGSAAPVDAGFSSARDYEIPLPLPAAGQPEIWTVQVQYRYKNAPFGQKSAAVAISVRG